MVAVMAQIVTMFRRKPGPMVVAGTVVGDIRYSSLSAAADDMPSRPASVRLWPVSMVA
jgi:hypothetical protein